MMATMEGRDKPGRAREKPDGGSFQHRMIDLLHHASVEVSPHAHRVAGTLRDKFDPGTDIFISFVPSTDYREVVKTAAALRHAGFNPVPHIPARSIANLPELDDFLTRLRGEAEVSRTLLIAGDMDHAIGPFASTMGLLRTELFAARGINSVGFAGHPEGHVAVSDRALEQALGEKLTLAARSGLDAFIVTQFCFTADPLIAWLRTIARIAPDVPVRIGVAGPATAATLIRFAIRCGIGNSMRAIQTRTNVIGRLLSETGPQEVLRGLSVVLAEMRESQVAGAHFYPFGGVEKTSDWIAETLTRLYAQITAKTD